MPILARYEVTCGPALAQHVIASGEDEAKACAVAYYGWPIANVRATYLAPAR